MAAQIGKTFFPGGNAAVQPVRAYAVFGITFLVRPLAGLVLGAYADRLAHHRCDDVVGLVDPVRLRVAGRPGRLLHPASRRRTRRRNRCHATGFTEDDARPTLFRFQWSGLLIAGGSAGRSSP
ncbi:hypothetical protein ACFWMR_09235 [Amycolatopsis thailandensis]|uniref:hypothetical protein n=1 Tax=Amycolatopsis thailandensis TaxID=589330 RepID=UPI003665F409